MCPCFLLPFFSAQLVLQPFLVLASPSQTRKKTFFGRTIFEQLAKEERITTVTKVLPKQRSTRDSTTSEGVTFWRDLSTSRFQGRFCYGHCVDWLVRIKSSNFDLLSSGYPHDSDHGFVTLTSISGDKLFRLSNPQYPMRAHKIANRK